MKLQGHLPDKSLINHRLHKISLIFRVHFRKFRVHFRKFHVHFRKLASILVNFTFVFPLIATKIKKNYVFMTMNTRLFIFAENF